MVTEIKSHCSNIEQRAQKIQLEEDPEFIFMQVQGCQHMGVNPGANTYRAIDGLTLKSTTSSAENKVLKCQQRICRR